MIKMKNLIRVTQVEPLEHFQCLVTFEDGSQKQIYLLPYLKGPIFDKIRTDAAVFRSVKVIDGTLGWENGADIDPDVLYYELTPAWMEEHVP